MSIKGFKRMHLHNMGHFRVRRVRVDHNEGVRIPRKLIRCCRNLSEFGFAEHVLTIAGEANIKMHEKIPLVGGSGNEARC